MSTESDDKEIKAMGQLISALKDLNAQEQDRVLSYVIARLDIKLSGSNNLSSTSKQNHEQQLEERIEKPAVKSDDKKQEGHIKVSDIRSFTKQKNPSSANEMAAIVAYFLEYEAPETERKNLIEKSDIEKYFHLANFKKPADSKYTLNNSKNAGYLESKGNGKFSLTPIGYNLVTLNLPHTSKK